MPAGAPEGELIAVLGRGELELRGRLTDASNATLLARAVLDGVAVPCVYKPTRGERPLWDFPRATLGRREVAAYELSSWSGLDVVPPTVWRDGPLGPGSVQAWIVSGRTDEDGDPVPPEPGAGVVDLFRPRAVPAGWMAVLNAEDGAGRAVVLAHADDPTLRAMTVFDSVANNADRKAGHILADAAGRVLGVDHGLTFNVEHKLRTVLWGFGGERFDPPMLDRLDRLAGGLRPGGELAGILAPLLSAAEVTATGRRARRLLELGEFPSPRAGYPTIPWPVF
jgi:uncharacterized repeat protein (TIGR03843 family)